MNQNYNNQKLEEIINVLSFYLHELTHANLALRFSYEHLFEFSDGDLYKGKKCRNQINTDLENLNNLITEMSIYIGLFRGYKIINTTDIYIDEHYLEFLERRFNYELSSQNERIITWNINLNNEKIHIRTNKQLFEIALYNLIRYAYKSSYLGTNINVEINKSLNGEFVFKIIYYGDDANKNIDINNIISNKRISCPTENIKLFITSEIIKLVGRELVYCSEKISDYYIPFLNRIIADKEEIKASKETTVKMQTELERLKSENTLSLILNSNSLDCITKIEVLNEINKPTYKNIFEVKL